MGSPQSPFPLMPGTQPGQRSPMGSRPGQPLELHPGLTPPQTGNAQQNARPGMPQQPGTRPGPLAPPQTAPATQAQAPAPCVPIPALNIACAKLTGVVGPPGATQPAEPANKAEDVRLIQQLINKVVDDGYVENSVLGGGAGKLAVKLAEDGAWSPSLFNAIKQIELLYFHGRANPHGIGVIDPQADESLFVFLVGLVNSGTQAKKQLSVQMKALALAMIPASKVMIDAGGTAPDGTQYPPRMQAVDKYLPILLDALTDRKLNDTDMVLIALACVFTETNNFKPISEDMYDLNTTGTFTNKETGATWTDSAVGVHSDYKTLMQHHNAALKPNKNFPTRGTETFTPNTDGPNGSTIKGDIYDSYTNAKGKTVNFNGNTQAGDGWKYRGRGLIQLTGRGRYAEADTKAGTGTKFIDDPDAVNEDAYVGVVVAGFLQSGETRIRAAMKNNDLTAVRKIVNGGTNGLDHFKTAMAAGRKLIAQAIIHQAQATTRAKRTGKKKTPAHK